MWTRGGRSSSGRFVFARTGRRARPERGDHLAEASDRLRAAGVGQPDDRGLDAGLRELAVAPDVFLDVRRALSLARLAGRDDARRGEVRHGDLAGVAALGRAVLAQDAELVADRVGVA